MKKLSIVLTYNNQPIEDIRPTLQMLNLQRRVNWDAIEILVCTSNKEQHPFDLTEFPNLVSITRFVHRPTITTGSAATRNVGIDNATGEWIFFHDVDDLLYSPISLYQMFEAMEEHSDTNVIQFDNMVENETNYQLFNTISLVTVHEKLYKLSLLRKYKLYFFETLTAYDDMSFNVLVSYCQGIEEGSACTAHIDIPIHLYTFNPKSITHRNNGEYFLYSCDMFLCWSLMINWIKNCGTLPNNFFENVKSAFERDIATALVAEIMNSTRFSPGKFKALIELLNIADLNELSLCEAIDKVDFGTDVSHGTTKKIIHSVFHPATLGIVITYHNEPDELTSNLFNTLENQYLIDWSRIKVFISRSDGETNFPDLSSYPNLFNVTQYLTRKCEISGPGPSRRVAMDSCDTDYVMFCDCDDSIASETSLLTIMSNISSNLDIYHYSYIRTDHGVDSINHYRPWEVWTATYKTSYLREHNITFEENLYRWEDTLFTIKCDTFINRTTESIKEPYYKYLIRDDSVCHTDKDSCETKFKQLQTFIEDYTIWYKNISTESISSFEFVEFVLIATNDLLSRPDISSETSHKGIIRNFIEQYKDTIIEYHNNYNITTELPLVASYIHYLDN